MTIKTLKLIHLLLEENAKQNDEIYQEEREREHNLEENGADETTVKDQRKLADLLMQYKISAQTALDDFESTSWT